MDFGIDVEATENPNDFMNGMMIVVRSLQQVSALCNCQYALELTAAELVR